jgi:hypothetical protein
MDRLTKLIVTIAFPIALVAYPLTILLPVEHYEIENVPVDPPQIGSDDLTSYTAYREFLSFVRQASPMRALLIRSAATLDFKVFGDSPDPTRVLRGTEGWLYFRASMENPCSASPDQVMANVEDFLDRLEADVPVVVFTIAPSKFVIHPEHMTPDQIRFSECAMQAGAKLRALMAQSSLSRYVDSWELFEQQKSDSAQTYFRTDTHFDFEASIPWIKELIDEVDTVWDPKAVRHLGTTLWLGNLTRFIGLDTPEEVEHVVVQRNLSTTRTEVRPRITHYGHTGEDALIPGKTLVLGDSFMEIPEESLVQYFADVTVVDWRADGGIEYFLDQLATSSVVIIEVSEMDVWERFADSSLLAAYESRASD